MENVKQEFTTEQLISYFESFTHYPDSTYISLEDIKYFEAVVERLKECSK